MTRNTIATLLLLTCATISSAHEFWIEPDSHRATPGKVMRMSLMFGERFLGETMIRDESHIEKFVLAGSDGEHSVVGRSGAPVSFVRAGAPGLSILTYRSRRRSNEMSPQKFEAYLREEGLQAIIPQRAALKETGKPGREVFSRCAKALILIGTGSNGGHDRIVGLPLEIVPETNPFLLSAGAKLTLRVLFQGKPLQDARVVLVNRNKPRNMISVRTDAEGRVDLAPPTDGVWMATTLHMTRAPADVVADWESFWASLTFEIPGDRRRADANTCRHEVARGIPCTRHTECRGHSKSCATVEAAMPTCRPSDSVR